MLDDDPTLEPRDVVVMCPDIESFAPLVTAAFGLAVDGPDGADAVHPGHRLRVRLADRSLRAGQPGARRRRSAARPRRRAAHRRPRCSTWPPTPAGARRLRLRRRRARAVGDWVATGRGALGAGRRRAARRTGSTASRRTPGGPGLDRLLVGVAMDAEDLRTVGLRAAARRRRTATRPTWPAGSPSWSTGSPRSSRRCTAPQPLAAWVDALASGVDDLTGRRPRRPGRPPRPGASSPTSLTAAGDRADTVPLGLADVRSLLGDRLRGRPDAGELPHRRADHVHDGADALGAAPGGLPARHRRRRLPAGRRADGDDVLARDPAWASATRARRTASCSSTRCSPPRSSWWSLYTGRRRAHRRGPAAGGAAGRAARRAGRARWPAGAAPTVLVRHPLQPFDARNFVRGTARGARSVQLRRRVVRRGAGAARAPHAARPRSWPGRCPTTGSATWWRSTTLVRFLEHPAKAFLRQRLGLGAVFDEDEPADSLPVELNSLEKWAVGDRLLEAGLSGVPRESAVRAEWLRGDLPPGPLGKAVIDPSPTTSRRW